MIKKTISARSPNKLDMLLAKRVKTRRNELRMSQQTLATRLGVTFQQVQKYEKATNRISASRLYEISRVLEVPVTFFFDFLEISPVKTSKAKPPPKVAKGRPARRI